MRHVIVTFNVSHVDRFLDFGKLINLSRPSQNVRVIGGNSFQITIERRRIRMKIRIQVRLTGSGVQNKGRGEVYHLK